MSYFKRLKAAEEKRGAFLKHSYYFICFDAGVIIYHIKRQENIHDICPWPRETLCILNQNHVARANHDNSTA